MRTCPYLQKTSQKKDNRFQPVWLVDFFLYSYVSSKYGVRQKHAQDENTAPLLKLDKLKVTQKRSIFEK